MFLGGVLTSLTPCIYPMIPITAAIVGGTSTAEAAVCSDDASGSTTHDSDQTSLGNSGAGVLIADAANNLVAGNIIAGVNMDVLGALVEDDPDAGTACH